MGTANRTNITKRSDKSTALTHPELDQNFDELGNVIDDQVNFETSLAADVSTGQGGLLVRGAVIYVDTIADLQALDTSTLVDGQAIRIATTGRAGDFVFLSGDRSANVTNDPQQGVWIAPSSDPTGASGAWVRRYDGLTGEGGVHVDHFGARDGADAYTGIQAGFNYVASKNSGVLRLSGSYEVSQPVEVTRDGAATGGIVVMANGARIQKGASFTGQCVVRIKLQTSDEDYFECHGLTVDGVDKTVNGIDWFFESVPYNALVSEHLFADTSYDKALNFYGVIVQNCYRGIRHAGNTTRFFGCTFKSNICGEFRVAASNNIGFFGCSFRRNQFGSHIATNEAGFTTINSTYSECIWESNSVVGMYNQGAGHIKLLNPYYEVNATDLTKADYLDKPADLSSVSTNFYQLAAGGFANSVSIEGGGNHGSGATTASIYSKWSRELSVKNHGGLAMIGGRCRSTVFEGGEGLLDLQTIDGASAYDDILVNGEKRLFDGATFRPVKRSEGFATTVYEGTRTSSAGVQDVITWVAENEDLAYLVTVEGWMSRQASATRNPRYEKRVFGINRVTDNNLLINEYTGGLETFIGPDSGISTGINNIDFKLERTGTEVATAAQNFAISANIGAGGTVTFATLYLKVSITSNGEGTFELPVVSDTLNFKAF